MSVLRVDEVTFWKRRVRSFTRAAAESTHAMSAPKVSRSRSGDSNSGQAPEQELQGHVEQQIKSDNTDMEHPEQSQALATSCPRTNAAARPPLTQPASHIDPNPCRVVPGTELIRRRRPEKTSGRHTIRLLGMALAFLFLFGAVVGGLAILLCRGDHQRTKDMKRIS